MLMLKSHAKKFSAHSTESLARRNVFKPRSLPCSVSLSILSSTNRVIYYTCFYLTTLPVAQATHRRMIGWLMNNESKRMWKEEIVTYFNLLSQHLPSITEENNINSQPGNLFIGQSSRQTDRQTEVSPLERTS
jgi:hypothetical protein